ncbi:MAG: cytochrome c maturation protein CcmE [Acidimicrobiia bacterium]
MKRYAKFVIPAVGLAVVLVVLMVNLSSALVYFSTPSEVLAREVDDARLRLGGRVVPGTVVEEASTVRFEVQDCDIAVVVVHSGAPPQLFQEGIGVVVEGVWTGSEFQSDTMLVKHDEEYRTDYDDYDKNKHACSES